MKTKLWIAIAFTLIAPPSQAALMDVEVLHTAYAFNAHGELAPTKPGKIGFTANLETSETFDWFFIHDGQDIGSEGAANLEWNVYTDGSQSAWVGFGFISLSNGFSFALQESWVPYLGEGFNPYESMAQASSFTFRVDFILDGEAFSALEISPPLITIRAVPEPATLSLLFLGLAAIGIRRRVTARPR